VDPECWIGLFQLPQAYEQLGEGELALDALNHAGRVCGGNRKVISLRGYFFAKLGRTSAALEVLNTLKAIAGELPPAIVDAKRDAFRTHPRFAAVLQKCGFGAPRS
jgi:hypothetical protein